MKFEFQFESLLNIRRHEEKKEQQKLGQLLSREIQLEERISTFKERLNTFGQAVMKSKTQAAAAIRQHYELKQDLQKKIWRLERTLDQLDEKIEKQREQLLEANRKTQMLEKLESRERSKFIKHYQDLQQKQQNEIATQMYNRNM